MRVRFITSTPWNVIQGSGTYVGIATLADSLRALGVIVDVVTPSWALYPYTLKRLVFNRLLARQPAEKYDATVGFDMDGYTLVGRSRAGRESGVHIAAIKGVIADEARFESGITRATMRIQAACEKRHVTHADLVITTSQYSRDRVCEFYDPPKPPIVVPELIDLSKWETLSARNKSTPLADKFIVLSVCRFYPRKRMHLLLAAADRLRCSVAGLEVRIVGDGPEMPRLKTFVREQRLEGTVVFLGSVSQDDLAGEYGRCHVFCLPSVQEGFGVVFLEAMANAKAIVAARAGAAPEVVKHGLLAEPDDEQSLARAIERLYLDPGLRVRLGIEAREYVRRFDAPVVAEQFVLAIKQVVDAKDATSSLRT